MELSILINWTSPFPILGVSSVVFQFYRKTGSFRIVKFSRNFAVNINPQKLKYAKYFPIFEILLLRN